MSSTDQLEKLHNECVKKDEDLMKDYKGLIEVVVKPVFSRMMNTQSQEFKAIYSDLFDGFNSLKIKKGFSEQEFDLNIVVYDSDLRARQGKDDLTVMGLGLGKIFRIS